MNLKDWNLMAVALRKYNSSEIWLNKIGTKILNINIQIFVFLLVTLQILKSGIRVPYSEFILIQIEKFPIPVEFHGGLSLLMPGLAKIFGVDNRVEYVLMSLFIGLICVYGLYYYLANYVKLGLLPLTILVFSPISASMLGTFSLHDPIFILGAAFAANFRNNSLSLIGVVLMSLAHPEASLVSITIALILTSTTNLKFLRKKILSLLLVSMLIFLSLRVWAFSNEINISRFEVLPDYLKSSTLNYLSNLSLEISILLWPLGILFVIALVGERIKDKILILLVLLSLVLVPFFGLDQTRDVIICGAISFFILSYSVLPMLEKLPLFEKNTSVFYILILLALIIAPQVTVGYTGIPLPPYSQMISIWFPNVNVGW